MIRRWDVIVIILDTDYGIVYRVYNCPTSSAKVGGAHPSLLYIWTTVFLFVVESVPIQVNECVTAL